MQNNDTFLKLHLRIIASALDWYYFRANTLLFLVIIDFFFKFDINLFTTRKSSRLASITLSARWERKSRAFKSPWNFQDEGRRGASAVVTSSEVPQMIASLRHWQRLFDRDRSPTSFSFLRPSLSFSWLIVVTSRYVCHPVLDYAHHTSSGAADCAPTTLPIVSIRR